MIQFQDMKYFIFPIILLSCFSLKTNAQEQDEVMYSMYRYHPKKIVKELGIDSVFIHTTKDDTTFLYTIITYDTLGRETKYIDVESGFEYRMDYYSSGLLKSTRIIDYDHGAGPVDSFEYNKKEQLIHSYDGMNGDYNEWSYKYKKGNLVESNGSGFKYKYTYKNGKRRTNDFYYNNGKVLKSQKKYEYNKEGNLYKIYEIDGEKWLNFQLIYNDKNLLLQMNVYEKNLQLSQQYTTAYYKNGLINYRIWNTDIKNNKIKTSDDRKNIYTYSYRD